MRPGTWDLVLLRRVFGLALFLTFGFALPARAADVIPPKPDRYFNDYANVVSHDAALRFNEQLAQFERETSNQVVVAVYPKMQSDSDVADYAQRIAQAWGVGQKDRSQGNGVVLLAFIADRKISIQVGYGLEGPFPDLTAFDIRERHISPHFRKGDYEGGLAEGISLICKAVRGEYKGSGRTVREGQANRGAPVPVIILVAIFLLWFLIFRRRSRGGWAYTGRGSGPFIGGWSGGSGWGGGSSSGGGFSGFSSGGGSFGGGGSSGSW